MHLLSRLGLGFALCFGLFIFICVFRGSGAEVLDFEILVWDQGGFWLAGRGTDTAASVEQVGARICALFWSLYIYFLFGGSQAPKGRIFRFWWRIKGFFGFWVVELILPHLLSNLSY